MIDERGVDLGGTGDLIRMILVPAIMELLGKRAWWMPHWLERRLPRLVIEPGRNSLTAGQVRGRCAHIR